MRVIGNVDLLFLVGIVYDNVSVSKTRQAVKINYFTVYTNNIDVSCQQKKDANFDPSCFAIANYKSCN